MSPNRLKGLDGLRGIAILLVVIYHLWKGLSNQHVLPDGSMLTFLYAGNTGVTLFFMLSGFLVSLPFIKRLYRGELYPLGQYALQRALGILPPYYAVGLVGIICTGHTDQFLPMFFFTADSLEVGYFSKVWWSLTTEVQFYLLLPLLFIAALNRRRITLLALTGSLAVALYLAVIFKTLGPDGLDGFTLKFKLILSVIGQFPALATGMLLAVVHLRCKTVTMTPPFARIAVLALLILLGWALLPAARNGDLTYMWHVLPQSLFWGSIIWLMLNGDEVRYRLLDNQVTRYFGRISLSLYHLHMPVLQLIQQRQADYGLWVMACTGHGIHTRRSGRSTVLLAG